MTRTDSWLVVRRSRWLALGVLVASLAIYVPLLGPCLVGARTMVDTSIVLRTEPWSAQAPLADQRGVTVANDTVDFYLPKLSVFVDALRHGDLATWEPYSAGGSPLASVPETASLSPLSLPYWVLPLRLAPAWVRLLEVLCAVGFMALFLRRLGLSGAAAWTGGLVYSTTGFVVLWNNWPQAGVAALVPSLFWAVERLLQRRTAAAAVPVALSVAALWLASFPSVLVYALYLLLPYVLVRTLGHGAGARDVLRRWLRVSAGIGLGLGLAAIQVLPFVTYLGTLDLGYRKQTAGAHAPARELLTVVAPYLFGTATQASYFGYRNVIEDIAYVGVVAMGLVLVGLALRVPTALPRRVTGLFVAATGVLAVVGWGSDRALGAAQHLPFIDTSYIGRVRVVLGFCLAVLAAVGADKLLRLPEVPAAWRRWFAVPLAVGLLVVLLLLRSAHHTAVLRHATGVFREGLAGPAAVVALTVTVLLMATLRGRAGMVAVGLLPILLAVEGLAFVGPSWPSKDPGQFYPPTPVHDFLAAHLGHERFGAARAVLLPGTSPFYRLSDVGGHSFVSPTWHREIEAVDPRTKSGPTSSMLGERLDTATSPLLDRMGTKYFVVTAEHPVFGIRVPAPPAHGHTGPVDQLTARLAPGPLRAIIIGLSAPVQGGPRGSVDVVLRDAAGDVVARARREAVAAGTTGAIPVPLVESPALARATTVSITLNGLSAQVPTDVAGNPVVGLVRPADDGLRLVFAAGSVIYERLRELPRVHLATASVVRPQREQLALMQRGLPPTAVVLGHDGPAGGGTGQVAVRTDRPERLVVTTATTGGTWLVVSEAMQHGWVAAVDGKRVPLMPADYSGVAVALPAGRHVVTIRYAAPGFAAGRVISLLSALILLALGVRAGLARHAGSRAGTAARVPRRTVGITTGADLDSR